MQVWCFCLQLCTESCIPLKALRFSSKLRCNFDRAELVTHVLIKVIPQAHMGIYGFTLSGSKHPVDLKTIHWCCKVGTQTEWCLNSAEVQNCRNLSCPQSSLPNSKTADSCQAVPVTGIRHTQFPFNWKFKEKVFHSYSSPSEWFRHSTQPPFDGVLKLF